jgi:hypothetical protein
MGGFSRLGLFLLAGAGLVLSAAQSCGGPPCGDTPCHTPCNAECVQCPPAKVVVEVPQPEVVVQQAPAASTCCAKLGFFHRCFHPAPQPQLVMQSMPMLVTPSYAVAPMAVQQAVPAATVSYAVAAAPVAVPQAVPAAAVSYAVAPAPAVPQMAYTQALAPAPAQVVNYQVAAPQALTYAAPAMAPQAVSYAVAAPQAVPYAVAAPQVLAPQAVPLAVNASAVPSASCYADVMALAAALGKLKAQQEAARAEAARAQAQETDSSDTSLEGRVSRLEDKVNLLSRIVNEHNKFLQTLGK